VITPCPTRPVVRACTGRAGANRASAVRRCAVRASAVALFLAVTTHAADAQDATPYDAITDEPARAAVRTIIADAAARGLPTAPLVTKVREGLAKQAAPERIRMATALLRDRLAMAAEAMTPSRAADELTAAADALQAGIPAATLRDMRRIWPSKPLTVPLGVLAEMVANGVSRPVATRRVRELLLKGATLTQFAALGTTVRRDIAAGLAPDAAMELRSKGVLSLIESRTGIGTASPPLRPTGKN
jgi:hypothetical protein